MMSPVDTAQRAHELIDRMAPGQLSAVVTLLEVMLNPVAPSVTRIPWEDEEISDEENLAVAESKAWLEKNPGRSISHEEVLAEYGLTLEDFERMGRTPLAANCGTDQ